MAQSTIQCQCQNQHRQNILRLIDKHFPRHHKYRKLLDRNYIKIKYSCMPNIVIRNHNTSFLKDPTPTDIKNAAVAKKQNVHWIKSVYLDIQCTTLQLIGQTVTKLNIIMELARRTSKSIITTTEHLLEIKIKKKALNSQSTSGS